MIKEHRLGVAEANLVKRHLKIKQADKSDIEAAIYEIDKLYGIDEVSYEESTNFIHLAYDASRLCIESLEAIIINHNIKISDDLWTRFKEGYYRFVDQNIKDNHAHEPWSCHKKP